MILFFLNMGNLKIKDIVCCIDILEHIEPEFIDNTILDLSKITKGQVSLPHQGQLVKFCKMVEMLTLSKNQHHGGY